MRRSILQRSVTRTIVSAITVNRNIGQALECAQSKDKKNAFVNCSIKKEKISLQMAKQRYQQEQKDNRDYARAVQGSSAEEVKRRVEGRSETQRNVLDASRPRNREQEEARD